MSGRSETGPEVGNGHQGEKSAHAQDSSSAQEVVPVPGAEAAPARSYRSGLEKSDAEDEGLGEFTHLESTLVSIKINSGKKEWRTLHILVEQPQEKIMHEERVVFGPLVVGSKGILVFLCVHICSNGTPFSLNTRMTSTHTTHQYPNTLISTPR